MIKIPNNYSAVIEKHSMYCTVHVKRRLKYFLDIADEIIAGNRYPIINPKDYSLNIPSSASVLNLIYNFTKRQRVNATMSKATKFNTKYLELSCLRSYRDLAKHLLRKNILEKIICGLPADIIKKSHSINNDKRWNNFTDSKPSTKNNQLFTISTRTFLECFFDYSSFSRKKSGFTGTTSGEKWNAYSLCESIDMTTCPYCNRHYINTIILNNINVSNCQLDHYFCKSKHPLLSISFYNLIPSCSTCNAVLKGNKEFSLTENIHPYLEEFGNDAKFQYEIKNINAITKIKSNGAKIAIKLISKQKSKKAKRIEGNIKDFKLREIYQHHSDIAHEIIYKSSKYEKKYLKALESTFNIQLPEGYQVIFGNYFDSREFSRRPLSKFMKDIWEQINNDIRSQPHPRKNHGKYEFLTK